MNILNLLRLAVLSIIAASPMSDAGTLIRGDEMLVGEKDLNKARKDASYPTVGTLQRAAGVPDRCVKIESKQQSPDCRQSKAGYWFCTGVTSVGCALAKAESNLANGKHADEATSKAKKNVTVDHNKSVTEWVPPGLNSNGNPLSEKEKQNLNQQAELAKRFKDREDQDTVMAKRRYAYQKETDRVRKDGDLNAEKNQDKKPPSYDTIDNAFASLDKEKIVRKKQIGEIEKVGKQSDSIDDAFAALDKQAGNVKTTKTGNIDNEFEKLEAFRAEQDRIRISELKAKLEREFYERKQKVRRDEATQFCSSEMRSQKICFENACKKEPSKTNCTEQRMDPYVSNCPKGQSCLFVPTYTCISKVLNPDYVKWESCMSSMAGQCVRNGNQFISFDDCVQHREK